MLILQNKLVMKSIEALHDDALSLVPDTASKHGINAPPAVLHATTPPQVLPKDAPKDTSADIPSGTATDHDIMARIDHLLKKLDEDDVVIEPLTNEGSKSNTASKTGDAGETATTDTTAIDNPADPNSPALSNAVDHANENAILEVAVTGMAEDTADKPSNKIRDKAIDDKSDDIFGDDQSGETTPPDQIQALADIATAIYQARQQTDDTVVADASQNTVVPTDMDVLSAAVADEVRRTVSAMMIAELPQIVRDAVSEAIRALPADARDQSVPATGNPPTTKSGAARKTAVKKKTGTKKAVAKKTRTKKAGAKKPTAKKTAAKKTEP